MRREACGPAAARAPAAHRERGRRSRSRPRGAGPHAAQHLSPERLAGAAAPRTLPRTRRRERALLRNRELLALLEEAITAWRPRTPDGRILAHPAWADLPECERERA